MSMTGLSGFDRTLNETNGWLREISSELGDDRRQVAYHAMRGVLFALRDRLMVDEALDLSAQLPMLVRGIFFEGYRVTGKPEKYHRKEFLERVSHALQQTDGVDAERATRAVLQVLQRHVSAGEIADIRNGLPGDLRSLWPDEIVPSPVGEPS